MKQAASSDRLELIETVRALYAEHGFRALSRPFLHRQKRGLYPRLLAAGLNLRSLLIELSLTDEYDSWRVDTRTYPRVYRWTWEWVIAKAMQIKERERDLPTVQWFRANGYSALTSSVHRSGRTWEDVREAVGSFKTSTFHESRNGMRWLSWPEASLSNFFYARGSVQPRGNMEYWMSPETARTWDENQLSRPSARVCLQIDFRLLLVESQSKICGAKLEIGAG